MVWKGLERNRLSGLGRRKARTAVALFNVALVLGVIVVACANESDDAPLLGDDNGASSGSVGGDTVDSGAGNDAGNSADASDGASGADGGAVYKPTKPVDAGQNYICSKDEVVFDLSALAPLEPQMSPAIASAWAQEIPASTSPTAIPSLVLAATGTRTGPVVARLGGVNLSSGVPTVAPLGEGTAAISIPYVAQERLRLVLPRVAVSASLTVGAETDRRAIRISAVSFELVTDDICSELSGEVLLEISAAQNEDGQVRFGTTTTLSQVFGAFDTDTDSDSILDGWTIRLSSISRGSAPAVALIP